MVVRGEMEDGERKEKAFCQLDDGFWSFFLLREWGKGGRGAVCIKCFEGVNVDACIPFLL